MATPFSEIYQIFESNITDYSLATMDDEVAEENYQQWLMASIPYFSNAYSDIEDYDVTFAHFNQDLSNTEKQILAKLMLMNYLNTQIFREETLKQSLNSKDYRTYSPAKHLETLQKIQKELRIEIDSLISKYSYNTKQLKKWFGKNEKL